MTRGVSGAAPRPWAGAAFAVLAGGVFALGVVVLPSGSTAALVFDNAVQLLAAATGAVLCLRAARATRGRQRLVWSLLAAGTGSWAAGQVVWSWYEIVLGDVPLLSFADAGFLAFSALAIIGLLTWLRAHHSTVRAARDTIDGLLIAGALLVIAVGAGVITGPPAGKDLGYLVSVTYALADVVLLSLALLTVTRAGGHRVTLAVLAAGTAGLAVSDGLYLYLASSDAYSSGNLVSAGWVTGFLLIAAAAQHGRVADRREGSQLSAERASRVRTVLPYAPLVVAETFFAVRVAEGAQVSGVETSLAYGLFALVLVRQFLVLTDNHVLLTQLRRREAELAHQAFHDPLTGLANRTQFLDSLELAAARHDEFGEGYGLLYCDLDDFKVVNDLHGHAAGDALLVEVGRRLRRLVSDDDVVARLGGDEFAVLVCGVDRSAETLADLVVEALTLPVELPSGDHHAPVAVETQVGVSVGVATRPDRRIGPALPPGPLRRSTDHNPSEELLKAADRSMYLAKAAGKGQRVVAPRV